MRTRRQLDQAFEALLADAPVEGRGAELEPLVADIRSAYGWAPVPPARAALTASRVPRLTTDKGDLPATAGSNANGPASQAAGLPKWKTRSENMLSTTMGKAAAAMVGGVLGFGGLGVAGALPAPLQDAAADSAAVVGVHLPSSHHHDDPSSHHHDDGCTDEQAGEAAVPATDDCHGPRPEVSPSVVAGETDHPATTAEVADDETDQEDADQHQASDAERDDSTAVNADDHHGDDDDADHNDDEADDDDSRSATTTSTSVASADPDGHDDANEADASDHHDDSDRPSESSGPSHDDPADD